MAGSSRLVPVLALIGLLLIAPTPLLFLLPFVGMTVAAGVRTGRERAWLIGTGVLALLLLSVRGGVAGDVTNASALLLTGAFLVASNRRGTTVFSNAVLAVVVALAAIAFWALVFQLDWARIEQALVRQWWAMARQVLSGPLSREVGNLARPVAELFPGRMVLSGLLGLVLAAEWHHRLVEQPLGPRPGRFTSFRLHLAAVWLTSIGLALLLIPGPGAIPEGTRWEVAAILAREAQRLDVIAWNLLLVLGGLYAACGLAIFGRIVRPGFTTILLGAVVVLLLPFVLVGLAAIGLADTWIDFRRRLPAPPQGG